MSRDPLFFQIFEDVPAELEYRILNAFPKSVLSERAVIVLGEDDMSGDADYIFLRDRPDIPAVLGVRHIVATHEIISGTEGIFFYRSAAERYLSVPRFGPVPGLILYQFSIEHGCPGIKSNDIPFPRQVQRPELFQCPAWPTGKLPCIQNDSTFSEHTVRSPGQFFLMHRCSDNAGNAAVAIVSVLYPYGIPRSSDTAFGINVVDPEADSIITTGISTVEHDDITWTYSPEAGHPERPDIRFREIIVSVYTCPEQQFVDEYMVSGNQDRIH